MDRIGQAKNKLQRTFIEQAAFVYLISNKTITLKCIPGSIYRKKTGEEYLTKLLCDIGPQEVLEYIRYVIQWV